MPAHYQVVLVDPSGAAARAVLKATISRRFVDLGLDPSVHLQFLDETDFGTAFDRRSPVVCVYFGGALRSPEATEVVDRLTADRVLVLPVLDSLDGYSGQVPQCLVPINAIQRDASDADMERIAGSVLDGLRLTRLRRTAFVSYRRIESRRVAWQIFHSLEERNYRVFLDTFSVEHGRPFQEALWDRMLDTDVLVFLHTKAALRSSWVEQEFARANELGLGILNVVWPDHSPDPSTALGESMNLEMSDFSPGAMIGTGDEMLTEDAMWRIMVSVEGARARAVADRRRRVVDAFCRSVDAFVRRTGETRLVVVLQSTGYLTILRGKGRKRVRVYPVVGHPDSTHSREVADACGVANEKGYLLFDRNGLDVATSAHLRWLNDYLPVSSFSTAEVEEWLPKL